MHFRIGYFSQVYAQDLVVSDALFKLCSCRTIETQPQQFLSIEMIFHLMIFILAFHCCTFMTNDSQTHHWWQGYNHCAGWYCTQNGTVYFFWSVNELIKLPQWKEIWSESTFVTFDESSDCFSLCTLFIHRISWCYLSALSMQECVTAPQCLPSNGPGQSVAY